jgi:subtilisin family serine protease
MSILRASSAWFAVVACSLVAGLASGAPAAQETKGAAAAEVRLQTRTIRAQPTPDAALRRELEKAREGRVHVILSFEHPLTAEEHEALEKSGVALLTYLGGNAYTASSPAPVLAAKQDALAAAAVVSAILPEDKLSAEIRTKKLEKWSLADAEDGIRVLVEFHADVDAASAAQALATVGLDGEPFGATTWSTVASEERLRQLAALDPVKRIEPGPSPFLELNETARLWTDTGIAQQASFAAPQPAYAISGTGVRVGICDSGVDENHDDFDAVTATGTAGASRVYAQQAGGGSHGTHVASIAGGSGLGSAANALPAFDRRGQAPSCEIGDYPQFGSDAGRFEGALNGDGTDVTNHSYVQSMTVYDSAAADIDRIVRGDASASGRAIPARPQVWAAGNNGGAAQYGNEEGYYAVFTSAKNTISVGSSDTLDGRLSDFSSLGPTFDGRIKPDVVAPGCRDSIGTGGIQAAAVNTQGYQGLCGTSMAAPVVSGIVALLMESFQDATGAFPNLRPSTYKALLVETADDAVKTVAFTAREWNNPDTNAPVLFHAGPDFATGWGEVQADAAVAAIADSSRWREGSIAFTGDADVLCMSVPEGEDEVGATIAWDDAPGDTTTPETTAKLVNDLELDLTRPDGSKLLPWTIDPLPLTATPGDGAPDPIAPGDVNPAYRGADHRNNVERASEATPASGRWRIRISGGSLPLGRSQGYSLATSHPVRFCFFEPAPICQRYPWICRGVIEKWHVKRPPWPEIIVMPEEPVPLDPICRYVLNCPGCEGSPRERCPGFDVRLAGVPEDAVAIVFDDRGNAVSVDEGGRAERTIAVEKRLPGEQFFVAFADARGNAYPKPLHLKVASRP